MMTRSFHTASLAACVVGWFATAGAAEREPSIPVLLRENGIFDRIIVTTDKPVHLADLVGASDLVVEATVAARRTYLDSAETRIYTDYGFTLTDIIKNRRRPGLLKPGRSTIVVRRESGTVVINGLRATTTENGFPAFAENGRYLLFLRELGEQNTYAVLAGGGGAFEVGDQVAPMLAADGQRPALSRQVFFGEVKALLKFTE